MFTRINALLNRRPYLAALIAALAWNVVLIGAGALGLASSTILIGLLIGRARISRWTGLFRQLPAALGCYAVVVVATVGLAEAAGLNRGLDSAVTVMLAAFSCPLLLLGEWIGWVSARGTGDKPA